MNAVMGLLRVQMCTTAVKGGERGMKGTSSGSPSCTALSPPPSSPFPLHHLNILLEEVPAFTAALSTPIWYNLPFPLFPLVVVVSCGFCAAGSAVGAAGGDI